MAAIPPRWLTEERLARALAATESLDVAAEGPTMEPPRRAAFHALRVAAVERLTADAVAITFDVPPHLAAAYRFSAGQHLDHPERPRRSGCPPQLLDRVAGPGRAAAHRGQAPARRRLLVLGRGGVAPRGRLRRDDPAGTFGIPVEPDQARQHVAVAVGSGITPVLSVLATLLAGEPNPG